MTTLPGNSSLILVCSILRRVLVRMSRKVDISAIELIGYVYAGVNENEHPVFLSEGLPLLVDWYANRELDVTRNVHGA